MKTVDRAAQVAGWAFLLAALAIAGREGSPARLQVEGWLDDHAVRGTIRRNWVEMASGTKVLGNANAMHRVVEFLDYRCAYCRLFGDTSSAFLNAHPDASILVRLAPRPGDSVARFGALAAACAALQGEFLRVHEFLLATDSWMTNPNWDYIRQAAGIVDTAKFKACEGSREAQQELATDSVWAVKLKLKGTPTFAAASSDIKIGVLATMEMESLLKKSLTPGKEVSSRR